MISHPFWTDTKSLVGAVETGPVDLELSRVAFLVKPRIVQISCDLGVDASDSVLDVEKLRLRANRTHLLDLAADLDNPNPLGQ